MPAGGAGVPAEEAAGIVTVPLEREALPVHAKGSVVAFRISYLGTIRVGYPAQEFKVIFDSGSGHVILPSTSCESLACRKHRRYNMSASTGGPVHMKLNGLPMLPGDQKDKVQISFGVGRVEGELVKDAMCFGGHPRHAEPAQHIPDETCMPLTSVMADFLSHDPYSVFTFDGIVGLGLPGLSFSREFSFFDVLYKSGRLRAQQYGVYLSESGDGSEISFGGPNPEKLGSGVRWAPVVKPNSGHWQVEIKAIRVGNHTVELCREGGCVGVVDTGTSHIAIPIPHEDMVQQILSEDSHEGADCRYIDLPPLVIELAGFNLTLFPEDYMRQIPVRNDIKLDSKGKRRENENATSEENTTANESVMTAEEVGVRCVSRVAGVNFPAPISPKLLILGQPVMNRYYTIFDHEGPRMGFGLASHRAKEHEADEALFDK